MDCRDAERFGELELDGELEPHDGSALNDHLSTCPRCREVHRARSACLSQVREKLRLGAAADTTPPGLRTRIVARVASADRVESPAWGRAVSVALAASMIVVLSWGSATGPDLIPDESISRHGVNLPPEVRAELGDGRPVHRFLAANLGYPVQVPRFDGRNPGVKLVGARLSSFDEREAAYVMYDHRGAKLSLFAYPKPDRVAPPQGFEEVRAGERTLLVGKRRGYNLVAWEEGALVYLLVSDVDPRELIDLAAGSVTPPR